MSAARSQQKFVKVNVRLYASDVEALRKQAEQLGVPYQYLLREELHRALARKKELR